MNNDVHPGKVKSSSYILGFVFSLLLTGAAYILVVHHVLQTPATVVILLVLAALQCGVQFGFFFHFKKGADARERLLTLGFAVLVVSIIIVGSLWIMTHLHERMQGDTTQMTHYMERQQGI